MPSRLPHQPSDPGDRTGLPDFAFPFCDPQSDGFSGAWTGILPSDLPFYFVFHLKGEITEPVFFRRVDDLREGRSPTDARRERSGIGSGPTRDIS